MRPKRPSLEVVLFADCDLLHSSSLTTGLIELAARGHIWLHTRTGPPRGVVGVRGPFTVCAEVRSTTSGQVRRFCFDLHDGSDYLCWPSLSWADNYLKANLSAKSLAVAGPENARKISALGPSSPCRPKRDRFLLRRCLGNSLAHLRKRLFAPGKPTTIKEKVLESLFYAGRVRHYLRRCVFSELDSPEPKGVNAPGQVRVLFRSSCWPETSESLRLTNAWRAELVMALRRDLGADFLGGLRRTGSMSTAFSATSEDRDLAHSEVVEELSRASIVIYGNGLGGCFSWRLVELLAAGRAVIAERIPNDAGFPLDEEHGIFQCEGVQQILEAVWRLKHKPSELVRLQQNAWRTYQQLLRPPQHVWRILLGVFQERSGAVEA